jgi:hypothetical protein
MFNYFCRGVLYGTHILYWQFDVRVHLDKLRLAQRAVFVGILHLFQLFRKNKIKSNIPISLTILGSQNSPPKCSKDIKATETSQHVLAEITPFQ